MNGLKVWIQQCLFAGTVCKDGPEFRWVQPYYWYHQNSTWLSGHVLRILISTTHDLTCCLKSTRTLNLIGAKIFSRSPSRVYNCPDTPGSTYQQSLFYKGIYGNIIVTSFGGLYVWQIPAPQVERSNSPTFIKKNFFVAFKDV